jgi:hypothetical protein
MPNALDVKFRVTKISIARPYTTKNPNTSKRSPLQPQQSCRISATSPYLDHRKLRHNRHIPALHTPRTALKTTTYNNRRPTMRNPRTTANSQHVPLGTTLHTWWHNATKNDGTINTNKRYSNTVAASKT